MNSQELAYVIITPYSLSKSRTGGIIARLIARTGLELVGARMFAPGRELITEYSAAIVSTDVASPSEITSSESKRAARPARPRKKKSRERRPWFLPLIGLWHRILDLLY